jgi:predicted GTPase
MVHWYPLGIGQVVKVSSAEEVNMDKLIHRIRSIALGQSE